LFYNCTMHRKEFRGWFSKVEQAQRARKSDVAVENEPSLPSSKQTLAVDSIVEKLWPLPLPKYSVESMSHWTSEELNAHLNGDRLFDNLILNKYEFSQGITELKSFPWRLSVPFILCNARCDFCAAWLLKANPMPADLITQLIPVLRHVYELDLVGFGEPLLHPQFGEILENIKKEVDPRARIALTTNGTKLQEWADRLLEANVSDFSISIHAATAKTHNDVMGLDLEYFDKIVGAIRYLAEQKKLSSHKRVRIGTVFIVMQQNIGEIPQFIDLCAQLGVDNIFLRTLRPQEKLIPGLDYHRLPVYLHPEFEKLKAAAIAAIQKSKIAIVAAPETWSTPIFPDELEPKLKLLPNTSREERLRSAPRIPGEAYNEDLPLGEAEEMEAARVLPQLDNIYARKAPMYCPSPYTAFYISALDRHVNPCCYMNQIPGYKKIYFKKSVSFDQVWNSAAMKGLRKSLFTGPLMAPCLKCPSFW
jgi:sulfatase maturation enzyme AslB (radical SAM superfamily)